MDSLINDSSGFTTPDVLENITPVIGSLGLTEVEIDDLIAFLHTLTDE